MSNPSFGKLGVAPLLPEERNKQAPPPTAPNFILVGESFLARDTIEDIFCPRFLLYPYPMRSIPKSQNSLDASYSNPVDHLDLTKTWKGLSSGQAEELIFWEDLFRRVLSDLLQNKLEFLCQETGSIARESCGSLHNKGDDDFHYIPISILDIVLAMVDKFKNTNRRYRWFTSMGNLYKAVAQFVRTHDCFTGGYQDSFLSDRADNLRIGVKLGEPDSRLLATLIQPTDIIAQVVWNPGYLCFEEFDLTPKEGGEFCLTPTYNPPFITPSTTPKTSVQGYIVYTTSARWLRWDSQTQSFSGTVPYLSEAQQQLDNGQELSIVRSRYQHIAYTLRITVRAIVTEHLDEKVRFEQSVRARITVNVAPNWTFESSPRLMNDLYSPEKANPVKMGGSPLSLPKMNLSEKPGSAYGSIYDSFQPNIGDSNCYDVQCYTCLIEDYPDANTPGQNTFAAQMPDNKDDQNERSSGSDTLRNPVVSTTGTHLDYPSISHNSFTWDYRVLTPEGTMHKHGAKRIPPKQIWSGTSAAQQGSYPGNERGVGPSTSLGGAACSDDNASRLEAINGPLQSGEDYPSTGAIGPSIQPDIDRQGTNSLKHVAKEHRFSSDGSDESIFAGWMRRSFDSSKKNGHNQTDSGYGSASTKLSDDQPASDNPTSETASKVPGVNEGHAMGSSDLYPGNSDSNIGSFATAGSNGSGRSTSQQGEFLGIGAVGDKKELKDENDTESGRRRRVEIASDEAVNAVSLLTRSLQEFQEADFRRLGTPWLVHQERKAEFAQMLRRRSQQEQELLGSDMEDIFFASSSDSSGTDSADDEVSEGAESNEGVPLDLPDVE